MLMVGACGFSDAPTPRSHQRRVGAPTPRSQQRRAGSGGTVRRHCL